MLRLDSFMAGHPAIKPTFIKIDVEGAGAMVLEGARETIQRHQPLINAEFHSPEERNGMIAQLEQAGYRGIRFAERSGPTWCKPAETPESAGHFLHPADPRVTDLTIGGQV